MISHSFLSVFDGRSRSAHPLYNKCADISSYFSSVSLEKRCRLCFVRRVVRSFYGYLLAIKLPIMGRHVGLMKGVFMIFDMSVHAQAILFLRFSDVVSIRLCNLLNGFVRVYMAFRMITRWFCIRSRLVVRHVPGPGRWSAGR